MNTADRQHARGRARLWAWTAVGLLVALAAFVGLARATDASRFCNTCHEMKPYYAAWSSGTHGHEGVQCIDCHVKAGVLPRLTHKVVALGEVWTHFFGDKTFPRKPSELPNAWCTRCHARVTANLKNFSHSMHETKGTCRDCHSTTGHNVTPEALRDAGVFNSNYTIVQFGRQTATVNGGVANVPGHLTVACVRCHNMQITGCPACHTAPKNAQHQVSANCTLCHQAGPKFVFHHAAAPTACDPCHKAPAKHTTLAQGQKCSLCHPKVGVAWTFQHPTSGAQCLDCHTVPTKHPSIPQSKACQLCHATGTTWAFNHPSSSNCSGCHNSPASHFGVNCASCHHRPGVTWAFAHPSAGEHSWRAFACAKCHSRGYATAYCSCHGGNPPSGD